MLVKILVSSAHYLSFSMIVNFTQGIHKITRVKYVRDLIMCKNMIVYKLRHGKMLKMNSYMPIFLQNQTKL